MNGSADPTSAAFDAAFLGAWEAAHAAPRTAEELERWIAAPRAAAGVPLPAAISAGIAKPDAGPDALAEVLRQHEGVCCGPYGLYVERVAEQPAGDQWRVGSAQANLLAPGRVEFVLPTLAGDHPSAPRIVPVSAGF